MNSCLMTQDVLCSTLAYVLGISETHLRVFDFEGKREKVADEGIVKDYRSVRQLLNSIIFGHNLSYDNSIRLRGIDADTCSRAIRVTGMGSSVIRQDKAFGTVVQLQFDRAVASMISWIKGHNSSIIEMFECFKENREVIRFVLEDLDFDDVMQDVKFKMDISNYPYMIYLPFCSRVKKSFGVACMFHDDGTLVNTVGVIRNHGWYKTEEESGSQNKYWNRLTQELKEMKAPVIVVDGEGVSAPFVLGVLEKIHEVNPNMIVNMHVNSHSMINWELALSKYKCKIFVRDFENQKIKNFNDMEILIQATKAIALKKCTDLIVISGDVDMMNLEHLSDSVKSIVYIAKSNHGNHRFISAAANANRSCYSVDELLSSSELMQVITQMV